MKKIGYKLKRSARTRTLRLAVHPDGAVVVTAPRFFGLAAIERFVMKHSEWVRHKVEEASGRHIIYVRRADIPALKKQALELAHGRLEYFAARYGFSYGDISVRSQKTRWGSCSENRNLSFNYKIAVLPERMRDYVIVHELCHTSAFDHSKRFWDLVALEIPEHKHIRKRLRNTVIMYR